MPKHHEKLFESMKHSKSKWKRHDLVGLYEGFGFIIEAGTSHDLVYHPDYPRLKTYLPRHTKIPKYLVRQAVRLVSQLQALEENEGGEEGE